MGSLQFLIDEGPNRNLFLQDALVNVHVVWRHAPPRRLQFCFPEGNAGVGVELEGDLDCGAEVRSWAKEAGLRGGEVVLTVRGTVRVGRVVLDTVRTLRDFRHPEALAWRQRTRQEAGHPEPAWKVSPGAGTRIFTQTDRGLEGRWALGLDLEVPQDVLLTRESGSLVFQGPAEWLLRVRGGHDRPALIPLGEARLLSPAARAWLESLPASPLRDLCETARRNLAFQVFQDKVVAGSWQYLTYFGRDTLLTSLLLGATASLEFHEAVLTAVLERLSPEGQVAHEEDIGEQAAYRERPGQLVLDYKMVDDDFLLLPAVAAVARHPEAGSGWVYRFLERHGEALERNAAWCLDRSGSLVPIDHDTVGDWRDSQAGLGGGRYANSVNVGLLPAFLEALGWFQGTRNVGVGDLKALGQAWVERRGQFLVTLSPEEIRTRLRLFLDSLSPGNPERVWMEARRLSGGASVGGWLGGEPDPVLDRGLTIPALSLDDDLAPVCVVNSDCSFRLYLADPDEEELDVVLTLLELPFPVGLAHPVGFLAANPALSDRPDLWQSLDRRGYHGTVVWSWQDAMLTLGLARQLRRPDLSPDFRKRIGVLLGQAARQRSRAGALVSSELWTWGIEGGQAVARAYGEEAGAETESNAVQLWSSAILAVAREVPLG